MWGAGGRPTGKDLEHWLRAEAELEAHGMPISRQHSTPKPEKRERQSHGGPQLNAPGGARIAQHVRMNRDDYQARRRLGMLS